MFGKYWITEASGILAVTSGRLTVKHGMIVCPDSGGERPNLSSRGCNIALKGPVVSIFAFGTDIKDISGVIKSSAVIDGKRGDSGYRHRWS
jgi:hypothetical protein